MDKKRRLWVKRGILFVIMGFAAIQAGAQESRWDWNFFLTNAECDFYYDPGTVFQSPESIIRVWWKEVFKTKAVLKSRGFTGSEYENVVFQINVVEINCPKKEYCRKFFMLCSEKGDNVFCDIHRRKPNEWFPVTAEQPIGVLYWKLCR